MRPPRCDDDAQRYMSLASANPTNTFEAEADGFWSLVEAYTAGSQSVADRKKLVDAASTLWATCSKVAPVPSAPGARYTPAAQTTAAPSNAPGCVMWSSNKPLTIEVGKIVLSETEKWKLQAVMRREETKSGGKEYNKNLMRPVKTAKGPVAGEGFPAGRGRPVVA